jgi:uncharacterized protein (TIGR03000 family)
MLRATRVFTLIWFALPVVLLSSPGQAPAEPPPGMSKLWPYNVNPNYARPAPPGAPAPVPPLPTPRRSVILPGAEAPPEAPQQDAVQLRPLRDRTAGEEADRVVLLARLPADADIWFEDLRLPRNSTAERRFVSPPLTPGQNYTYHVWVNWAEGGHRAEQALTVRVGAGDTFRLDLRPGGMRDRQAEIKAGLDRLSPEDRKLAEQQGVCAVQESIPLGTLGVPVKVLLKGQPVFLSCEECLAKAEANPDEILARVAQLRAKKGAAATVVGP